MKLRFRRQQFQADAAKAVCDVFAGQPFAAPSYMIDPGKQYMAMTDDQFYTGHCNSPVVVLDEDVRENIRTLQRAAGIKPSEKLEGKYNLTLEMETGVGKTYTYIKTMYELNKHYGWNKFIVVVPSVAIREGVHKSFQITQEHFVEEYGKKIRYFIYNSAQLTEIEHFASDSSINVMIINSQAFNARGKDARRIYMQLDEFRSRKPIDILAKTNPILIIDEPQSVEGKVTKERLQEFNPLMTLRYSATHKADSVYNMIYRLDALEAYNKRLVKKIAVKGITMSGGTATEGYVYLQSINLSKNNPTATIEFDFKGKTGIRKISRVVNEGYNLFANSGELEQYREAYIIAEIDGASSSIKLVNGKQLHVGDVIGNVLDEHLRRLQIRETILSHLEKEEELFNKGIKVLSLFFIDEVARYRQYDAEGAEVPGFYAEMFEEEYKSILESRNELLFDHLVEYQKYLENIKAERTHAGYFSIDKTSGRIMNSKPQSRKEDTSDDIDAYNLIMRDKERLLNRNEPVRFIFSHSALREGWDNPNVFQICTLKQSGSDLRKRQEVGRGLRLAVNQNGERMDENLLAREEIHRVNKLTIIANESYSDFAQALQTEIAEAVAYRPCQIDAALFLKIVDHDKQKATIIHESLIENGYVKRGTLTEKFYNEKESGNFIVPTELKDKAEEILTVLDTVYSPELFKPEDAFKNNIDLSLDKKKLNSAAFQKLWEGIKQKSSYLVDFEEEELIKKSISALNLNLAITKIFIKIESGEQVEEIESKGQLEAGEGFIFEKSSRGIIDYSTVAANSRLRYDLIGKIVEATDLTRKTAATILKGINEQVFEQFAYNPEEFILRAANLINEQKATLIIEHISYNLLDESFNIDIFTEPGLKKAVKDVNAMPANRHLYNFVVYDSKVEKNFATELESHKDEVEIYVKLPRSFYINTPVGKYNPDWAIAFYEEKVKHVYFVAETKGDMSSLKFREIEDLKINCARKHFHALSGEKVKYGVISTYEQLWDLVRK